MTRPVAAALPVPSLRVHLRRSLLSLALAIGLVLAGPIAAVRAVSVADLPPRPPVEHVIDDAHVLSRAGNGEIERQLESFSPERVDARLITLSRLDYGLDLATLGYQLVDRWSADPPAGSTPDPLLLLLIDTQTRSTAIVAQAPLDRQLPLELLDSTASTTMAQPLRSGDRYRQAGVDALQRLATVLQGGEDPGEPVVEEAVAVVSNIPTREETSQSNAFTWVVVLLVVGSVVPMLTWWVFSR
ncbi:photosystem II repair protein Psb32 [Synechococcus sp. CCY 9618]|uniref:photosystem II repair protein Psb32 n=1 Tax=Synechococcus sp. CCY 9618 TaxID=2815602 RepID=UPI00352D2678